MILSWSFMNLQIWSNMWDAGFNRSGSVVGATWDPTTHGCMASCTCKWRFGVLHRMIDFFMVIGDDSSTLFFISATGSWVVSFSSGPGHRKVVANLLSSSPLSPRRVASRGTWSCWTLWPAAGNPSSLDDFCSTVRPIFYGTPNKTGCGWRSFSMTEDLYSKVTTATSHWTGKNWGNWMICHSSSFHLETIFWFSCSRSPFCSVQAKIVVLEGQIGNPLALWADNFGDCGREGYSKQKPHLPSPNCGRRELLVPNARPLSPGRSWGTVLLGTRPTARVGHHHTSCTSGNSWCSHTHREKDQMVLVGMWLAPSAGNEWGLWRL